MPLIVTGLAMVTAALAWMVGPAPVPPIVKVPIPSGPLVTVPVVPVVKMIPLWPVRVTPPAKVLAASLAPRTAAALGPLMVRPPLATVVSALTTRLSCAMPLVLIVGEAPRARIEVAAVPAAIVGVVPLLVLLAVMTLAPDPVRVRVVAVGMVRVAPVLDPLSLKVRLLNVFATAGSVSVALLFSVTLLVAAI